MRIITAAHLLLPETRTANVVISLLIASNKTAQEEMEVGSQNQPQKLILKLEHQVSALRQYIAICSCMILLKLVTTRNTSILDENVSRKDGLAATTCISSSFFMLDRGRGVKKNLFHVCFILPHWWHVGCLHLTLQQAKKD